MKYSILERYIQAGLSSYYIVKVNLVLYIVQ